MRGSGNAYLGRIDKKKSPKTLVTSHRDDPKTHPCKNRTPELQLSDSLSDLNFTKVHNLLCCIHIVLSIFLSDYTEKFYYLRALLVTWIPY